MTLETEVCPECFHEVNVKSNSFVDLILFYILGGQKTYTCQNCNYILLRRD